MNLQRKNTGYGNKKQIPHSILVRMGSNNNSRTKLEANGSWGMARRMCELRGA